MLHVTKASISFQTHCVLQSCESIGALSEIIECAFERALQETEANHSRQRSALLPNIPAIAETTGLERFESVSWYSLVAPSGTPKEIAQAIAAEVTRALQMPALRDKLQGLGAEGVGGTPEQLLAIMRSDCERYGDVIRRLKLKPD
jgi:tripartite-type tricarboxylate transporter receptor subunit TctC